MKQVQGRRQLRVTGQTGVYAEHIMDGIDKVLGIRQQVGFRRQQLGNACRGKTFRVIDRVHERRSGHPLRPFQ
jgi:hypothetical protein